MTIIDNFLQRYAKEYDYYYELAKQVASICETLLHRNGIRAIVTYRAKKPDSLREKLTKRHEIKGYKSIDQIYKDIVDLAGVRIATYFPEDREEIGRLIESEFITKKVKLFPSNEQKAPYGASYKKRFAGYDAMHFRVNIKEDKLDEHLKRYTEAQVEIQIASALMHAWAEVEHDMAYKPKIGSLSEDEFRILDELNGLVLSGEIALERLQKAFKLRISQVERQFNNHYELAALIREKVAILTEPFMYMGRVDILHRFLQRIEMDIPEKIYPYIHRISCVYFYRNIVNKIIELILNDYPEYYKHYIEAKYETRTHNPFSPIEKHVPILTENKILEEYVAYWTEIGHIYARLQQVQHEGHAEASLKMEAKLKLIIEQYGKNSDIVYDTKHLCTIRDQVLYGNDFVNYEILDSEIKTLQKLVALARS